MMNRTIMDIPQILDDERVLALLIEELYGADAGDERFYHPFRRVRPGHDDSVLAMPVVRFESDVFKGRLFVERLQEEIDRLAAPVDGVVIAPVILRAGDVEERGALVVVEREIVALKLDLFS